MVSEMMVSHGYGLVGDIAEAARLNNKVAAKIRILEVFMVI